MSAVQDQLASFTQALGGLLDGSLRAGDFSAQARAHTVLLEALPPRYTTVLHDLLDRLESSALFSDESCSFSQQDLIANLQVWLDKATTSLN